MLKRITTGACLTVFLIAVLYLGGWYFAAAAVLAVGLSLYEELRALQASGHRPVCWTAYAGLLGGLPLLMLSQNLMQMSPYTLLFPYLALLCFAILFQVLLRAEPKLEDALLSVMPLLTIVLPGLCLLALASVTPRAFQAMLLTLTFVIAVLGDTFAFLVGSQIGGRKLCPVVSPKKTVSGAIGGLLGSIIGAVIVQLVFSAARPAMTFPPLWLMPIIGLIGGVAGQMGDLFASMVKRHCGVKDYSNLFPGHGGMLDRMDSILFVSVVMYAVHVLVPGV